MNDAQAGALRQETHSNFHISRSYSCGHILRMLSLKVTCIAGTIEMNKDQRKNKKEERRNSDSMTLTLKSMSKLSLETIPSIASGL